ncbi:hypothetical protein [Mesorhizobium sp. 131-2-1]|uniref:hypothetical protein n=1 Tax=Mesorhizobium sp. 131-2-1 TaxID=2744518 RepID=UPI0019272E02|nr:hypothetical protein [Mesorhizobium sp. 131-2-1]BCG96913.1 hypothetical protein MesoLj131a_57770 [Mesorhizobium sp. 131-2-1]
MRTLLVASLAVWSFSAFAFDATKTIDSYNEARPGCRQAEMNGQPISTQEADRQCKILARLGEELKANGYYWNDSEQEWAACR